LADSPATGGHDAQLAGLRREQLSLLCRVMSRAPVVNVIVVGFICYVVWDYVATWSVLLWAAAVLLTEIIRLAYARRMLASPPADANRPLAIIVWIALLVGSARGSAMPLFFATLPPVPHAALSVIFIGFCAGGLSTHGAYARAFYAFSSPMLLAIAVSWLGTGTREGVVLVILFGVFALMVSVYARESERLVRESFFIRHERDQLVAQLDAERQQVALARDDAELANRAKSRFLASASHDLRQPLHALSLFSAALSLRATDPEVRDISGNIGRALRSLSALVDALLDISKLDAGAVKPEIQHVDTGTIAERIAAEYRPAAERKGLELRVTPCDASAHTDPVLLDRILRNLVDNAVKYTASGRVSVGMEIEGSMLRIAVSDSGEGIPAAERERIFEEFYQIGNPERDRTKGLGLGLAIVRRIARLLGTDVELVSDVGRGSTFTIRLPLATGSPAAYAGAITPPVPAGWLQGRGVLVIDDEPDVRVGMRTLLETWGCRVTVCSGLEEAERLLNEHDVKIDLIVADLRLRANETGIETVKRLHARLGPVPALLVTGDTAPERLREAQASGLSLLHKPVSPDTLRDAMAKSLRP
jgi:signal transduction histidine kinase